MVLIAHLKKLPSDGQARRVRRVAFDEGVAGIILRSPVGREVIGNVQTRIEVEPGCVIEGDADVFTQVNRAQNSKLVAAVMRSADFSPGKPMLDMFCGAGNFSLPACRRGASVIGVDAEPLAIEAARKNAARERIDAQFVALRAREMANFLGRAQYRPEVVIVDPPRTGARDLIEPIAKLRSPKVIYVSCDPPTMARDLRSLSHFGYRIADVHGFDLFPNTHHVEVVAGALLT
jgi:23S rRNA (uracil1939-C5)-methyltransferase